jgi:hypothetical protein
MFLLFHCTLYFPKTEFSVSDIPNQEEITFTIIHPSLEKSQSVGFREFIHKNLHHNLNDTILKWKGENINFRYIPVMTDITGVDHEFDYKRATKKNLMEVQFHSNQSVGTLNSFLYIFSLGIIPGFQDTTWYTDLKIFDSKGKVHNLDSIVFRVSEISSSLFFPIWLTGYKTDIKIILREILKKTLLTGSKFIEENSIPFNYTNSMQGIKAQPSQNIYPDIHSPVSIVNTILECNIHLQEKGTPNVISYHPPVGQGGLCRWSVVFYNHTEEEIRIDAKEFQLFLANKKSLSPFTEIFVKANYYNQGASTSNYGIRKLNSNIVIPSYRKGKEDATLGIAYPFTNYTFYFPYNKKEDILSLESNFEGKKIGILYQE